MENSFRDEKNIFNLQVDEVSRAHMLETAKWTKFIGIVYIIFLSLYLIIMIFAGSAMTAMSSYGGANAGMMAGLGAAGIIVMALVVIALVIYPIYSLIKYANLIKPALHTSNQQQFNEATAYMKGFFKYIGIVLIVVLSLYALVFIFAMLGAAM